MVVFADWSDYTRRKVSREYIVGRDDAGKDHMPERMTGTRAYSPISASVRPS